MEIEEFLRAVFDSWVEIVGIILTLLPFVERVPFIQRWLKKKPLLERFAPLLWIVGGVCMFWGFYSAWGEQRHAKIEAERKLEELTKPNLVLTPNQIMSGDTALGLELLVEVTIKNLGAPSAVTSFQMRAQGPGFDTGRVNPIFIPEGYTVWNGVMKVAVFHSQMLLQEKAAHAIQRGDQVGGWIRFIFPINTNQLKSGKTTLTIYFKDINDKEYNYSSDSLPPQGATYSPATGATPFVFPLEVKPEERK